MRLCLAKGYQKVPATDQPPLRQAASGRHIQSFASISFVLAQGAIITIYFNEPIIASILFSGSILLSTRNTRITNSALNDRLSDLKKHQEWEQYLKTKNRRRFGTTT